MSTKQFRVEKVLDALNTIQQNVPLLTDKEEAELKSHLDAIANAFNSDAPEDVLVPHIQTISLSLADVAGMVRDAYGVGAP